MKRLLCLCLIMALELLSTNLNAASSLFVTPTGAGLKTGANWLNALDATFTQVRGNTYYLADGSYGSFVFGTPTSGTTNITIQKCTTSDGVSSAAAGYSSTLCDGQATFSQWSILTGYYVLNGATRNESNWFDGTAYGFSVGTAGRQVVQIDMTNCGNPFTDVTIQYVDVQAMNDWTWLQTQTGDVGSKTIYMDQNGCGAPAIFYDRIKISRIHITGGVNQIMPRSTNNTIVEYSALENAIGTGTNHGDAINLYYDVQNFTGRYNKFRHEYTTACIGGDGSYCGSTGVFPYCCGSNGAQLYGNSAFDFRGGDGIVGYSTCSSGAPGDCPSHSRIYNNTWDTCNSGPSALTQQGTGGVYLGNGTDNIVQNNLWVNCSDIDLSTVAHDYNTFPDSGHGEVHEQDNFLTSNFVSYSTQDYRLNAATPTGNPLASPFNVDPLGNTRGADGTWDRGAFEFVANSGDSAVPNPPSALRVF